MLVDRPANSSVTHRIAMENPRIKPFVVPLVAIRSPPEEVPWGWITV
jgi:hypothetical protein